MKHFFGFFLALALSVATPAAARVAGEPLAGLKSIEFLNGWRMADGRHMAAVRIRLQAGWKTYWRAPGGIGIPATFDWTGSENLSDVRFHWPAPEIYDEDGLITVGYKNELVLPVEFTASDAGAPIVIRTELELGVCADVCVPTSAQLTAVLPPDGNAGKAAITAALAAEPVAAVQAGISRVSCTLATSPDGFTVEARFRVPAALSEDAMTLFEYPHPDVWIDGTEMRRSGRDVTVTARLYNFAETPLVLDRRKMRMTVLGRGYAADIMGCPAA